MDHVLPLKAYTGGKSLGHIRPLKADTGKVLGHIRPLKADAGIALVTFYR